MHELSDVRLNQMASFAHVGELGKPSLALTVRKFPIALSLSSNWGDRNERVALLRGPPPLNAYHAQHHQLDLRQKFTRWHIALEESSFSRHALVVILPKSCSWAHRQYIHHPIANNANRPRHPRDDLVRLCSAREYRQRVPPIGIAHIIASI